MGKKSSDPADVVGAAHAEGRLSAAQQSRQMYADRPDQFNTLGSVQWTPSYDKDPMTGETVTRWSQEQRLSDRSRSVVDPMFAQMGNRAALSRSMDGRVAEEMADRPDWEQFGDAQGLEFNPDEMRGRAEDAIYGKETMRLGGRFEQERESTDLRLRQQGLRPGDQAYDSSMESFGQTKNDAYEAARFNAITGGQSESAQMFQQQQDSANHANALRDSRISEYIGQRGFSLGEQQRLNPINDLTSISGLITGQGLGGNTPDSHQSGSN